MDRLGEERTNHVADDENWDLELRRTIWGKSLNGANRPFICVVAERDTVRIVQPK